VLSRTSEGGTATDTRILGIDLAVTAAHRAIVLDVASNHFVSSVLSFSTDPTELDRVLTIARAGAVGPVRLVTVLKATCTAWFSVGTYLDRRGVEVYRVNGQQVGELQRIYQRRAKSGLIDARVLAKLYFSIITTSCAIEQSRHRAYSNHMDRSRHRA
jgi:Transposase